ncbi:hypothetical protein D3C80_1851690 [compost metagenome]
MASPPLALIAAVWARTKRLFWRIGITPNSSRPVALASLWPTTVYWLLSYCWVFIAVPVQPARARPNSAQATTLLMWFIEYSMRKRPGSVSRAARTLTDQQQIDTR